MRNNQHGAVFGSHNPGRQHGKQRGRQGMDGAIQGQGSKTLEVECVLFLDI